MTRSATILRNIASNWVGFAVNAAVTLALTPVILRELGTARYGIWILTSSIIGYYGFLDLGFRAGVTQYLTRFLAIGDHVKASECMSSAVVVLCALGAVMFGLSLGAAYLVPGLFELPGEMQREAFWCILTVGCSSAIQFALSPFTSVFTATQRFDLANVIGVTTRLLTAGGIVLALEMDQGLLGVSIVSCMVSIVDYLVRWRVAYRLAPQLEIASQHTSWQRLREVGAFGAWNFLVSLNMYVYQHVPNILIACLMPIAAVGHYALATGLTRQLVAVLSPVGQVIYPAAAHLHAQRDQRGLELLYHDASRLMLLATTSIVVIAAFWAEDFYRLWIGEKYLSTGPFHSVALLFEILLVSICTSYFSSIAGQILMGAGHVRMVATALICGSMLNLSISFLLIGRYGLVGVAAATVIVSLVIDFIAIPLLLRRTLGLSLMRFLRRACVRPIAAGAFQAVVMVCIRLVGEPEGWIQLALQGIVAGAATVAIVVVVGVTGSERQRYLVRPIRRLVGTERQFAEVCSS